MTSKPEPAREAYVWIWLPGETAPVVAGRIEADGDQYVFNYGKSYLDRSDRMPIYLPELPLEAGTIYPEEGLSMAGALRDGLPDAWGRRVLSNQITGYKGKAAQDIEFDELTYMLESGSDRMMHSIFRCRQRTMCRGLQMRQVWRSSWHRPQGSRKERR